MRKRKWQNYAVNGEFWESEALNNSTYRYYYNRLTELATTMFKWENLPKSVDERYLELTLFSTGMAIFFKDEVLEDYLALTCMIGGNLDVYRIPKIRRAYATNGYNKSLTDEDSVIIFNDYLHNNTMSLVEMYARKLYLIDRTIDVNVNAQKTPLLIICDENERLTMRNLYQQYDGNEPFIFGDKKLNPNSIQALKTDAPYVCGQLQELKTQIWNEALTALGISNVNITKKERMISDEVIRSQGGTIASRYSRLQMRRQGCEQINELFGLNISVDYRQDYREADDELMFVGQTGDGVADVLATDVRTN